MGFRVIAVGRGRDIAAEALQLGAHRYIDTRREDAAAELTGMGGTAAILATVGAAETVASLLPALAPGGRLVLLGIGKDPLAVPTGLLVDGERSIAGSITGSPQDCERALAFSVLTDTRPRIETLPLEDARAGYERLLSGEAKFRIVLTMEGNDNAHQ